MRINLMKSCRHGILLALIATLLPFASSAEPFKVDPATGQRSEAVRDYSDKEAKGILKRILIDWMTNPSVSMIPYSYLLVDETGGKKTKPQLRLLIDRGYVPKGFTLEIPGVPVELFNPAKRELKEGELYIRLDRFERIEDGVFQVEFVHTGYGIIGGVWTTYEARLSDGQWVVKFLQSYDP
jgi:hypothetical protein